MTDDLTRGFVTRRLASERDELLREARYIADSWAHYVSALESNPESYDHGEPLRLADRTNSLLRSAARLDAAREMVHTLMSDRDHPAS